MGKILKTIIISCFLLFIIGNFVYAQKPLEVEYPAAKEAQTPTTTQTSLFEYIKYIFNFIIIFSGLVALGALIRAGVIFLTSSGKPERLTAARQQIISAFWGMIILLSSYIILTTINPRLTVFPALSLQDIVSPKTTSPISPTFTADILERIKLMAEELKKLPPEELKNITEELKNLTNNCNCQNTQSLCSCSGGGPSSSCQPINCYIGKNSNPCPDEKEIKKNQQKIIQISDQILYYRNRSFIEKGDLEENIKKIVEKKISWYEEKIRAEEKILEQLENEIEKRNQQEIIDKLKEEKSWLEEEKKYKEQLKEKLQELADAILKIKTPTNELSQLPNKCFSDVKTKCQASCKGGSFDYGCYDAIKGCQPDKCGGGNPCPSEINSKVQEISSLPQNISDIANQIIQIVDSIPKERQSSFNF